jgi:hypothetical protein
MCKYFKQQQQVLTNEGMSQDFRSPNLPQRKIRSLNMWILLDSQSTVLVLKSRNIISNIKSQQCFTGPYQQWNTNITRHGYVKNDGYVWFNKNSLSNIMSMVAVRKKKRISMDMEVEPAMHVHKKDGSIVRLLNTCQDFTALTPKKEGRQQQLSFLKYSVQ